MVTINTRKEIAQEVFGIQYLTLWRWCRHGVPRVRRRTVDNILWDLECRHLSAILRVPNVEDRLYGLSNPYGFRRRLGRLFPVFSEK